MRKAGAQKPAYGVVQALCTSHNDTDYSVLCTIYVTTITVGVCKYMTVLPEFMPLGPTEHVVISNSLLWPQAGCLQSVTAYPQV